MFSVTNTGMNFLPLWTAKERPIKSGVMVERRDQVLMIFLAPAFSTATFLARWSSMKGPFLIDLAIFYPLQRLLFCALFNNEAVCGLIRPCLVPLGRDTPRCYRVTSPRGTTFT